MSVRAFIISFNDDGEGINDELAYDGSPDPWCA
jgi:hypothetical protein